MQHAGRKWFWASDAIVRISTITQYWESGNSCSNMVVNAIATFLPRQNFHTWSQTRQTHQVRLVIVSKNSDTSVYKIDLVIGVMTSHSLFMTFGNLPDRALCLASRFVVLRVTLLGKGYVVGQKFPTFQSSPESTAQTLIWGLHNPSKHQQLPKPRIFLKARQTDKMEITT
jgi:hypothetical protein